MMYMHRYSCTFERGTASLGVGAEQDLQVYHFLDRFVIPSLLVLLDCSLRGDMPHQPRYTRLGNVHTNLSRQQLVYFGSELLHRRCVVRTHAEMFSEQKIIASVSE